MQSATEMDARLPDIEAGPEAGRVSLTNVSKRYTASGSSAVDNFSLDIQAGEFVSLLGPSGCGKTTTLRMIAGFEMPSEGRITLDGDDLTKMPPNRRPMSMVFQSYALFPHLTVRENVAYGLKLKKLSRTTIRQEVDSALATMNLTGFESRGAHQLSGGQQQRVALARALVMKPKVLLFDEPLSNLDAKLRAQMRLQIRRLQQRLGITSIFVTHDQEEAMTMSDRIVVMRAGKVHQVDTPEVIYRRPFSVFVADFIGSANFLSAAVESVSDGRATVEVLGSVRTVPAHPDVRVGSDALLLARPEAIKLSIAPPDSVVTGDVGRILVASFTGGRIDYEVESTSGNLIISDSDPDHNGLAPGDFVQIEVDFKRSWLLPHEAL